MKGVDTIYTQRWENTRTVFMKNIVTEIIDLAKELEEYLKK